MVVGHPYDKGEEWVSGHEERSAGGAAGSER